MILCLDIGNTHLHGGLYKSGELQLQFRYPTTVASTSDQLGLFLKNVIRENKLDPQDLQKAVICSVVPSINYSIRAAFLKYFALDPHFLQASDAHGIQLRHMTDLGTDRIASAIAAMQRYPKQPLVIVDLGTATTVDAFSAEGTYLGGLIMPGLNISMKALYENTAKLSPVNITKVQHILGETTITQIQSGLYYGHLGALREALREITTTIFQGVKPIIVGTGGFSHLFEKDAIFTVILPALILDGLYHIATFTTGP